MAGKLIPWLKNTVEDELPLCTYGELEFLSSNLSNKE